MAVVRLKGVSVWTPERKRILDDISWTIEPGEHWVILGPNGAGKTTLLSLVGADRHPSEGEVVLLGETVGRTDMRVLRSRIGRIDPAATFLDWLTGIELVLTGLKNTVWPRWEDWSEDDFARAKALLQLVGAAEYGERELRTLSHGERQRMRIARALIASPALLLLDEPATGLDFPSREAFLVALDTIAQEHAEMPTVTVSHHLEELPTSITHALLLRDGRVLDQGSVADMLTSERITACFGFPIDVHPIDGRWAARAAPGWSRR